MTEKRFTYDSKTVSILKDGEFWLDGNVDTACNHSEICEELNELNDEKTELKKENGQLKEERDYFEKKKCDYQKKISILTTDKIQLKQENEQLKSEKQAIIDILDEMENGDCFWDRDYLIDRISDIETAIGVDLDG